MDEPVEFRAERAARPEGECDVDTGTCWLHLTEDQAEAVAGGYVPRSVKSVLREMLDYRLEEERRAARPIPKHKKRIRRKPAIRTR